MYSRSAGELKCRRIAMLSGGRCAFRILCWPTFTASPDAIPSVRLADHRTVAVIASRSIP
jgi:hypothetical protein